MPIKGVSDVAPGDVRAELDRILKSESFVRSARLSRFLSYIVERTLEGRRDGLKEYVIGADVYDKGSGFDSRIDSTVRMEASRLRSKLREYYEGPGSTDPIRIVVPKGGYTPTFQRFEIVRETPDKMRAVAGLSSRTALLLLTSLLVGVSIGAWMLRAPEQHAAVANLVVPFTTLPGRERAPCFSPDGKQIAFVWDGPVEDNADIYVKMVGGGQPLRLTTDPAPDLDPAWSPDGSQIAFYRGSSQAGFFLVPALGGPERLVSKAFRERYGTSLDWFPDGKSLAIVDKTSSAEPFSIYKLLIATGERHRWTHPALASYGDRYPRVSPDGTMLAFIRSRTFPVADIYVLYAHDAEPQRLTFDDQVITGLTWSEDAQSIVFSSERGATAGVGSLWRIAVRGPGRKPASVEQLSGIGNRASAPAIARHGRLLTFQESYADSNIWRTAQGHAPALVISSTREEHRPQYSPDGSRIAFDSNRSGNWEIWVAGSDGSQAIQLTSFGEGPARFPRWSPDGRLIAFDHIGGGNADVYAISVEGGQPHRITNASSTDQTPDWARDGKWIFFTSNRTGTSEIWKTAVDASGTPDRNLAQLTHSGGAHWPEAARDSRSIFFMRGSISAPELWKVSVDGGRESQVMDSLPRGSGSSWTVDLHGVYFIDPSGVAGPRIAYFDFVTRRVTTKYPLDNRVRQLGLAVSPDSRSFLYTRNDSAGSDLMVVQNFR